LKETECRRKEKKKRGDHTPLSIRGGGYWGGGGGEKETNFLQEFERGGEANLLGRQKRRKAAFRGSTVCG